MKESRLRDFFVNGTSIFLGLIFFTAGMAKVFSDHKFPGLIGPVWLEERLEEFQLGLFARFIALAQIFVGYLLLTLRFRTLGAVMLVPMVLNIFMVTVSMAWQGTPYVLAFFIVLNFLLLMADKNRLLPLLGYKSEIKESLVFADQWKFDLLWLFGFGLVLLSIWVSFVNLYMAYIFTLAGIIISLFSFGLSRRARLNYELKAENL